MNTSIVTAEILLKQVQTIPGVPFGQPIDPAIPQQVRFYLSPRAGTFAVRPESIRSLTDANPDPSNFLLKDIAAGTYTLFAGVQTGYARGVPVFVARAAIDIVDHDVRDISLTIEPGAELKGEFKVLDNPNNTAVNLSRITPSLVSADDLPPILGPMSNMDQRTFMSSDGRFVIPYVAPGKYYLRAYPPQGFYLAAAWLGPRNVLGQPFEVTAETKDTIRLELSGNGARVKGKVTTSSNSVAQEARVVLVPPLGLQDDINEYKVAFTDAQGAVEIVGIRPGAYTAFAFSWVQNNAWTNREFMAP